ncbi:MAG: hypothetical protein ACKO6K_11180 [Chitinophagaceae bacterium]
MTTKNYFLVSAVLDVLFGVSLVFLPDMMTQQYLVDSASQNSATILLCRLFGSLLLSLAVGLFIARDAGPSSARKGLVIAAVIVQVAYVITHVTAINQGVEKPFAWGTVGISVVMFFWGIAVLRSNK